MKKNEENENFNQLLINFVSWLVFFLIFSIFASIFSFSFSLFVLTSPAFFFASLCSLPWGWFGNSSQVGLILIYWLAG